ncbi:hypothetical protein NDU88_005251 [Pleurodeles waltl]|uniref:Uncharacterized protein n=1 Tax=Pleurodeles waltl TaxID=8319 RepID=A0AAV7UJF4_PLEWA|nr:hypothetical protein NDU88_005251 [Pleurodeles waltl]
MRNSKNDGEHKHETGQRDERKACGYRVRELQKRSMEWLSTTWTPLACCWKISATTVEIRFYVKVASNNFILINLNRWLCRRLKGTLDRRGPDLASLEKWTKGDCTF